MPKVMKGRGVSNMAHVRPWVISSSILKGGQTKNMVAKDFTWDQRLLSQPSGFPRQAQNLWCISPEVGVANKYDQYYYYF